MTSGKVSNKSLPYGLLSILSPLLTIILSLLAGLVLTTWGEVLGIFSRRDITDIYNLSIVSLIVILLDITIIIIGIVIGIKGIISGNKTQKILSIIGIILIVLEIGSIGIFWLALQTLALR